KTISSPREAGSCRSRGVRLRAAGFLKRTSDTMRLATSTVQGARSRPPAKRACSAAFTGRKDRSWNSRRRGLSPDIAVRPVVLRLAPSGALAPIAVRPRNALKRFQIILERVGEAWRRKAVGD